MQTLMTQIAREHGLGRENLATEMLVYLLEWADGASVADLLKEYGIYNRDGSISFQFKLQSMRAGGEIPDIQVMGASGSVCALIENKFDAGLTERQPVTYLNGLSRDGVLLFVVPERRQWQLFMNLVERCRIAKLSVESVTGGSSTTCAMVDCKRLEVTSWERLLDRLLQLNQAIPRADELWANEVGQLRRFCEVTDKETLEPLTPKQVAGDGIASVIRQLTWITNEVLRRSVERRIASENREAKKTRARPGANVDSSLYYGQKLNISGLEVWIGFWGEAWEERRTTPLWIVFTDRASLAAAVLATIRRKNGSETVQRGSKHDLLIPIPITPGHYQEQVVEEALIFLSRFRDIVEVSQKTA